MADIYAKAGDREKAKEILQKVIKQKTDDPINYYRIAELLMEEDQQAAKDYLEIAMQYWAGADADYIPWQRAQELAGKLGLPSS